MIAFLPYLFLVLEVNASHWKDSNNRELLKKIEKASLPLASHSILNLSYGTTVMCKLSMDSLIYIKYIHTPDLCVSVCFLFLTVWFTLHLLSVASVFSLIFIPWKSSHVRNRHLSHAL